MTTGNIVLSVAILSLRVHIGTTAREVNSMKYYFWVSETELHDRELAIIEASQLDRAREIFTQDHPEDVDNIESISLEDQFAPLWQKGDK